MNKELEIYKRLRKSPLYFVKLMWGLKPERDNEKFIKGKHLTWQQHDILLAVEKAINGEKKRITVRSGHGIGKSTVLSWLILWYLFCHKDAQVPCTAPTSDQIYDVLWKELAKWLDKMPEGVKQKYDYTMGYLRIVENPKVWFARAKTARKESPEALAGVHGDYVMFIIDEASGVPDEIFNVAEGALTGTNVLVIMISNPTRLQGYFYESHFKDKYNWQTLAFNSIDSPIVDKPFVDRIIDKHGEDSDEYRIRVLGEFPKADAIDDKGYVPLLTPEDLKFDSYENFMGNRWIGIDPSGEGRDTTVWVLRDNFKAKVLKVDKISNVKDIASKTVTLMYEYKVKPENIIIDNFGVGANIASELAFAGHKTTPINVGDKPKDVETFLNLRAEMYWKLREWVKKSKLIGIDKWDDLLIIKYKRNLKGLVQIMSKDIMRQEGYKSPDIADALMLTFYPAMAEVRNNYEDIKALENISYEEWI